MSLEQHFACPLLHGVHARPASALEEVVRGFASEVVLVNQRTRRAANGKSILAIVGADIRHGDPCVFTVSGPDEREAMAVLSAFLQDEFPRCDEPLAAPATGNGESRLPPGLRNAGVTFLRGMAVAPGIALGRAVPAGQFSIPSALPRNGVADARLEWLRLESALDKLSAVYDLGSKTARSGIEAGLAKVHRAITRDVEFRRQLREAVSQRQRTAAGAIEETEAHFSASLAALGSTLLCDRALDIQDVCFQLLRQVYGPEAGDEGVRLTADAVVIAQSLTPGRFLALDRNFLKGLALASASAASHTVILARSFGIPTLAGVENLAAVKFSGQEMVVDGEAGMLVMDLTEPARRYYRMELQRVDGRKARLRRFSAQPAATLDGHHIEVAANIATADESLQAFAAGAEGIGLFRTEMLFLEGKSAPDEEEQFESYRRVVAAAKGRPVVIRTLDVGGDKALPYLRLPTEENPFLGCRAVRIYPEFETLFRTQIRALLRASAHGNLKVMFPMVATLDEVHWLKEIVAQERAKCVAGGIRVGATLPLGAMIEVPATAFALDALCRELDFFSIGSNDLLQYFMAADRANPRVAGLYNPLQPAFLRLLKHVVDGVRQHHREISLCGEMGGQARFLPLLAGLGLGRISTAPPAIAMLKAELAGLKWTECRQLLESALGCPTAGEVAGLLDRFAARHCAPLLEPDLMILDAGGASTKEEMIKLAIDQLFVQGRTDNPRAVEEAVWQREEAYSTGFGHGFAIPHCKTDAVHCNSLVLLKTRTPAAWNSLDGEPVRVMILLAIREADAATGHMKVLAKLARRLMDRDFRERLEQETNETALCAFLEKNLGR